MELKERLRINIFLISAVPIILIGCADSNVEHKKKELAPSSFFVDTSLIKNNTVISPSTKLVLNNGIFYFNNLLFSGYIKKLYPDSSVESIEGILNGMMQGRSVSYFEDGQLKDVRMYKENKSFGKSYGFWEDGKMKFEYYYLDDKRHGSNKQWYKSGLPYAFMNFKDDKEDGMQQAWRENGKPYINYEVKDGIRYGLQKSNLCYTLVDEKFKSK